MGVLARRGRIGNVSESTHSDLVANLRSTLDKEARLKDLLVQAAREAAHRMIGPEFEKRVSATEMACSVVDSLMSSVKNGRVIPENYDNLVGLLIHRIKWKAANGLRDASAQRRDVQRETDNASRVPSPNDSPVEEAQAREQGEKLAKLLCQPPDEIQRLINLLSFLGDYSAPVIHTVLSEQSELVERVPSVRWIQLWLQKEKLRIAQAFGFTMDE